MTCNLLKMGARGLRARLGYHMALFGLANLVCAAYREKSDKNAKWVEFLGVRAARPLFLAISQSVPALFSIRRDLLKFPSSGGVSEGRGGGVINTVIFASIEPPRQALPATPPEEGNNPRRLCLPPLQRRGIISARLGLPPIRKRGIIRCQAWPSAPEWE
jgi:hypothetical protein